MIDINREHPASSQRDSGATFTTMFQKKRETGSVSRCAGHGADDTDSGIYPGIFPSTPST